MRNQLVPLKPGMLISIPCWRTSGLVRHVEPATFGSAQAINVCIQENLNDPSDHRHFRVEPEDYIVLSSPCCHHPVTRASARLQRWHDPCATEAGEMKC